MIVMNPPYQRKAGFKNNLAIEFFNKVLMLKPEVIVFYYEMKSFLSNEIQNYVNSGYKIVSHIFSNAKTTFKLSEWPISQVIFEKPNFQTHVIARSEATKQSKKTSDDGLLRLSARNDVLLIDKYDIKNGDFVTCDRYELNPKTERLEFIKTYTYDSSRPNLIKEIEKEMLKNNSGLVFGRWSYLRGSLFIGNSEKETVNKITTNNLKWVLLSKGINFNTHDRYFERNDYVYRGKIDEISNEIFSDAIIMSLFYINFAFTNKNQKNYIMPFTSSELGCAKNDLNVLFPKKEADLFSQDSDEKPFDFREFLSLFEFSEEAKNLYKSALEVFRFYHKSEDYQNKDWNDSFYDITNAIMGKDVESFKTLDAKNDRRITKVKTTKGTRGFGRSSIKYAVSSKDLPMFENFFDARDVLAKKINKELLDAGLLLWKRENIY